jgi:hypothetical protein
VSTTGLSNPVNRFSVSTAGCQNRPVRKPRQHLQHLHPKPVNVTRTREIAFPYFFFSLFGGAERPGRRCSSRLGQLSVSTSISSRSWHQFNLQSFDSTTAASLSTRITTQVTEYGAGSRAWPPVSLAPAMRPKLTLCQAIPRLPVRRRLWLSRLIDCRCIPWDTAF